MLSNLKLSMCEPFVSPSWGSNFVVFSSHYPKPISEGDSKKYLEKACRYANKYGVYLVPEIFTVLGILSLCLIGPDGKVITAQQEIFTNRSSEINNANLNLAKPAFGRIMLCVNNDIYHPELPRIAFNRGVEIIVSSFFTTSTDNINHKLISGPWNAAQNNNLYSVAVSNTTNCICAPKSITKNNEGFVLAPTKRTGVTELDFSILANLPQRKFLPRSFYSAYRSEILGS